MFALFSKSVIGNEVQHFVVHFIVKLLTFNFQKGIKYAVGEPMLGTRQEPKVLIGSKEDCSIGFIRKKGIVILNGTNTQSPACSRACRRTLFSVFADFRSEKEGIYDVSNRFCCACRSHPHLEQQTLNLCFSELRKLVWLRFCRFSILPLLVV